MEEQLVSLRVGLMAKTNGFDWECENTYDEDGDVHELQYYEGCYNGGDTINSKLDYEFSTEKDLCTAPTQAHLQKWLREIHYIHIVMNLVCYDNTRNYYSYTIYLIGRTPQIGAIKRSYEDALELALGEALELI